MKCNNYVKAKDMNVLASVARTFIEDEEELSYLKCDDCKKFMDMLYGRIHERAINGLNRLTIKIELDPTSSNCPFTGNDNLVSLKFYDCREQLKKDGYKSSVFMNYFTITW